MRRQAGRQRMQLPTASVLALVAAAVVCVVCCMRAALARAHEKALRRCVTHRCFGGAQHCCVAARVPAPRNLSRVGVRANFPVMPAARSTKTVRQRNTCACRVVCAVPSARCAAVAAGRACWPAAQGTQLARRVHKHTHLSLRLHISICGQRRKRQEGVIVRMRTGGCIGLAATQVAESLLLAPARCSCLLADRYTP